MMFEVGDIVSNSPDREFRVLKVHPRAPLDRFHSYDVLVTKGFDSGETYKRQHLLTCRLIRRSARHRLTEIFK